MLNLSELKQTRFYQEVKQEGIEEGREEGREEGQRQAKLNAIPRMVTYGLNAETIAQLLDLPLELVRETITQIQSDDS
jgi:predicted transposase/invertase (TIGR01784 family)